MPQIGMVSSENIIKNIEKRNYSKSLTNNQAVCIIIIKIFFSILLN